LPLPLFVLGSFLAGFIIGRVWAVLIPCAAIVVMYVQSELTSVPSDSPTESTLIVISLTITGVALALVGIALRYIVGLLGVWRRPSEDEM
jgi:EamA domain-containing membrane protein RarD